MAYEKLVAVFDTADHAQAAVNALVQAGFSKDDIHLINKTEAESIDKVAHATIREPGFWHKILGNDVVEYEGHVFGTAVDKGGTVLSVRLPDTEVSRAQAILESQKVVDIEDRAHHLDLVPAAAASTMAAAAVAAAKAPAAAIAPTAGVANVANEEVIRLAEEQLNVGKAVVQAGTTTVRRYVTEKAVDANVTLHEEHAEVMRRAIADPAIIGDIDWSEKTVVVTETNEKAVVNKVARIAEEVVVRRTGSDRTETIHDTVRRQQVDVGHTTNENK